MSAEELGVCIIGCGYMGTHHSGPWNDLQETRIVSVCDLIPERSQRFANLFGLDRIYENYREAVLHPGVDVVSVCIPTSLHAEAAIYALEQGKHVLCEKPMALYLEDTDLMIAAAQASGKKLTLGFMRRHSPVLQGLRDALREGLFGRPVMYFASDIREMRPKRVMHDPNTNGGPVIDMGVHLYDQWGYLFDSEPVEVYAQGLSIAKDRPELAHIPTPAIDTATVQVRYASGDMGTFTVTWGLPPLANPEERTDQIYGPSAYGEAYYGPKQELRLMKEGGLWETAAINHQNMYANQAANFIRSILEDQPLPVTGEDGKKALKVALAALESIQTNKAIHL